MQYMLFSFFFFFHDTATTEIYSLSLRRSSDLDRHNDLRLGLVAAGQIAGIDADVVDDDRLPLGGRRAADAAPERDARDRKSTRLNSSHSQISYAGFCLEKKTTRWATAYAVDH